MARVQGDIYPYSDVGRRLVQLRKALGLSQAQLAERLGVHWQTILRIETGQRKVNAEVLAGLCGMGYDATWLLTGQGDMLLKDEAQVEEQRLLVEYWRTNYSLLETALKLAYRRLVDSAGESQAEKIFKELRLDRKGDLMIPHPVREVIAPGQVSKKGKKKRK